MAMATPVHIRWVPEDDLLLKDAIEAGASLEALAKGAVQFSRKYTLQELQERWYSLLYDPDISSVASTNMFELEISGINPAPKFNRAENFLGNKKVSEKRKSGSIRRKYYAMRKKYRSEFFSNTDLGFFEHNPAGFLKEEDLDILRQAFPETIRDIAVAPSTSCASQTGCPNSFEENKRDRVMVGYEFDKKVASPLTEGGNYLDVNIKNGKGPLALSNPVDDENLGFEGRQQISAPNPDRFSSFQRDFSPSDLSQLRHCGTTQDFSALSVSVRTTEQDTAQVAEDRIPDDCDGKENTSGACTGEFADPDSLLNLSNEDESVSVDINEKHGGHKHHINNLNSVLGSCNNDVRENEAAKVEHETVIVSEASLLPGHHANPLMSGSAVSTVHGDNQMDMKPALGVPSTSTLDSDLVEFDNGKICCMLNTEDTEIPCNDDIFLLIHPSTSFGSFTEPITSVSTNTPVVAHAKDSDEAVNLPAKDFGWPQKVELHGLQELNSVHALVVHATKNKAQDSRSQVLPGFSNKAVGESNKGRSLYEISKLPGNSLPDKEVTGVDIKVVREISSTATDVIDPREAGYGRTSIPKPAPDSSASDHEEYQIQDDVPFFSDIEAMILEMDLDPYDQDTNILRHVPSFQYDETKRAIIRLEQGSRSCLQRAMTSQGALAILYGRHLRHYIRKPEVLLGRSTEDIEVDIDLRREGRANKISRRQAIIKLETDGSFFLKNLGKSAVSVNGAAVATGQFLNLSSSCLIEIKGMSFVFEINSGYVRKHLSNFCLKNKKEDG